MQKERLGQQVSQFLSNHFLPFRWYDHLTPRGNRKEVLPFSAALYLSTSDDSQTPGQRKILSSWDNMLLVLLSTALIPVLEDLSHSLACSMPLGGRHSLGSLRLKHKVYF